MNFGDSRLPTRFWRKVSPLPSGCWIWIATTNGVGYGAFRIGSPGRLLLAHRHTYETLIGPIGTGLQLDHLCRNRACVNPAHLEPVTHRENILRGESIAAANAKVTHCPKGHEYTAENTLVRQGKRSCKTCNHDRSVRRAFAAKADRHARNNQQEQPT